MAIEKYLAEIPEHYSNLIDLHEKIKNYEHRMDLYDQTLLGTWRSYLSEYLKLFKSALGELWSCEWPKEDKSWFPHWWYHDLMGLFWLFEKIYIDNNFLDKHGADMVPDIKLTLKEFYDSLGLTDFNKVMLFLEALLMDIHHYIEYKEVDSIHGVFEGRVANPHNGYYYRWMCNYVKTEKGCRAEDFEYIPPINKGEK